MILTLLFAGILLLGILGVVASINDWIKNFTIEEIVFGLSSVLTVLGATVSIIFLVIIIISHSGVEADIHKTSIERDGLIKRLEIINSEYEDYSKSDVINDITKWNKNVYSNKYWSNNPWTNWFYDKDYVNSLEYIDIE